MPSPRASSDWWCSPQAQSWGIWAVMSEGGRVAEQASNLNTPHPPRTHALHASHPSNSPNPLSPAHLGPTADKLIEDGPLALPLSTTNNKTNSNAQSCLAFGTTYRGGGVHSADSPTTATATSPRALFVAHLPWEGRWGNGKPDSLGRQLDAPRSPRTGVDKRPWGQERSHTTLLTSQRTQLHNTSPSPRVPHAPPTTLWIDTYTRVAAGLFRARVRAKPSGLGIKKPEVTPPPPSPFFPFKAPTREAHSHTPPPHHQNYLCL
jgi:hypothetical protein